MSALFPCLFVLTVRLGGVRHFENELDHAWFQQLSAYVQVEIESRNGTLKIPFGSAQHFSYVRTLNLGTIFTGPGTYRIGDPDCIDISSPSFVSLYANGDSGVREPVKQFIKTVTKHYQDNRLRLMAHFPILSVTSARETCKCVGDVLRMTKSLIRLEISRQIVGFVGNEGACAQMMCRFGSLQVLYLSSFEALLKTDASLPGVMLLREICNKQFVRGLPAFLGLLEANAKQLQCVYLEAAGDLVDKKEVGMGDCIARALASLDNFERALPFVDVCTLRGQLLTWKLQLV